MPIYFIALTPEEKDIDRIDKLTRNLPEVWVPTPRNDLHLTALHLGETPEEVRPYIENILDDVAEDMRHFFFKSGRINVMQPDEPYMIWLRFDEDRTFTDLVRDLELRFVKIGSWRPAGQSRYKFGNKAPLPHITLARARGGRLADSLISPITIPNDLSRMHYYRLSLYESVPYNLAKEGVHKYTLLKEWRLKD